MTDLIQYASVSAVSIDKQVKRQARAVATSGAGGKKAIIDGYIVSTMRTSNGTLTRVVDTPAVISFMNFGFNPTSGTEEGPPAVGRSLYVGSRDKYQPGDRAPSSAPPVAPPGFVPVAGAFKYVAPAPANPNAAWAGSSAAWVDGDRVYACGTLDRDDVLICVVGLSFGSKLVPDADYAGLIVLDPLAPTTTSVLYVYASAIVADAGGPDVTGVTPFPVACSAAGTTYFAVGVSNEPTLTTREAFILACAVTDAEGMEVPMAWSCVLRHEDYAEEGSYYFVRDGESDSMHVGDTLTVCSTGTIVGFDAVGNALKHYGTTKFVLNKDTGAIVSHAIVSFSRDVVYAAFASTSHGLWVAVAERTPDSLTIDKPAVVQLWAGASVRPVALAGWAPMTMLIPGHKWYKGLFTPGPTDTRQSLAVVQLGVGVLGVLACPPQEDGYYFDAPVPYHLLEVDEDTLTLIADRGFIANTTASMAGYGVNITVVTPQQVDSAGVVTVPAVLLVCHDKVTRLSTDGGATWGIVATGMSGYPYYRGNRLHPVKYGESL